MKKQHITIGQTYRCKISGSVVDVRITGENPQGGWDAINTLTNRKVRIKSAQRLRGKTPPRPTRRKKIVTLAEYEAEGRAEAAARSNGVGKTVGAVTKGDLAKGGVVPTEKKKATTEAKTSKRGHTGPRGATAAKTGGDKPMSCLTAAVQVLKERGQVEDSLNCKQMIERMDGKGYWKPSRGGKTPAATLYSAILREIAKKGKASRFVKASRGKFTLTKGA